MVPIISEFIVGWTILGAAILINVIAKKYDVLTWHTYLQDATNPGQLDCLFLYVIYPLLLGIVASSAVFLFSTF